MTQQTLNPYNGTRTQAQRILSLTDAKLWLNIAETETKYDYVLELLLDSLSQEFEQYIDGPIIKSRYDEIHDGDFSDTIVPQNKPVREIKHILLDTTGEFKNLDTDAQRSASPLRLDNNAYYLRDDGTITFIDGLLKYFGTTTTGLGKSSILVDYEAGWADESTTIPSDIKYAASVRIEQLFLLKQNRGYNVTNKRAGDSSQTIKVGMPKEVTDILDRYVDQSFHKSSVKITKHHNF